jgi:hypothetical protein
MKRFAITFCFKAGLSATETLVLVQNVYGNEVLNGSNVFDVLTSIVSFIWAPSTRGGVAYGVRTLSTNRNSY